MKTMMCLCVLALSLSGCASFHQAASLNMAASQDIDAGQNHAPQVVEMTRAPYLMGTEITSDPASDAVLLETVTLVSVHGLTISQIAGQITAMTGLPVDVTALLGSSHSVSTEALQGGLPPPPSAFTESPDSLATIPTVSLNYHGSLKGLLNTISAQIGLSYRLENGRLIFFKTETRVFLIPALVGSIDTTNSIVANSGASGGGGISAGSSSGSSNETGTTTVNSTSNTNVWSGIEKTASSVADGAKIITDPSTGTITATGTPAQLDQIAAWVQALSNTLSRQVAVTIHIYKVQLNDEQNYGFNPQLAFRNKANQLNFTLQGAPSPTISSPTSPFSFGASIISGRFEGTQIAVQALATLGQVSQVFSQSRVTLNGQPASIQVAQQTGYLASSQVTTTANVGSTSGLTPGSITTGFTGTITPRVVGDKIYLGMNMVISTLETLKTVTDGSSSIQVPTTDDTVVSQSAMLNSGSVLMITGYNEADGSITKNGVGSPNFPLFGGGGDASTTHSLIAIVISARTL